jgi:hypothetical protein
MGFPLHIQSLRYCPLVVAHTLSACCASIKGIQTGQSDLSRCSFMVPVNENKTLTVVEASGLMEICFVDEVPDRHNATRSNYSKRLEAAASSWLSVGHLAWVANQDT